MVDTRLHMKGHTGDECKKNNDPALFPELEDTNTVVCEQVNFWLGKFKHILKHINFYRFNSLTFFTLIILSLTFIIRLK